MAIQVTKLSDTVWTVSDGATVLMELDSANNFVNIPATFKVANKAPVIGTEGGYKIARSSAPVALDGSNPTSVTHGLTTCIAAFAQLTGSVAPGDSTSVLSVVINGASLDVYGWKHTTGGVAGNPTLIASTGTESFNWFAIGI